MIYGYLRKSSEEGSTSSFDTQKFKINSGFMPVSCFFDTLRHEFCFL